MERRKFTREFKLETVKLVTSACSREEIPTFCADARYVRNACAGAH